MKDNPHKLAKHIEDQCNKIFRNYTNYLTYQKESDEAQLFQNFTYIKTILQSNDSQILEAILKNSIYDIIFKALDNVNNKLSMRIIKSCLDIFHIIVTYDKTYWI